MSIITDYTLHDILTFRVKRPESFLRDIISNPSVNYKNLITHDAIEPDINLTIGPFEPDLEGCVVVDNRYYVREDFIFFQDSYKIANWAVAVSGFESGKIHIQLKCSLFGLIFSISILELMIRFLAVKKGYAFIHSFGIGKNGKGTLFPARSGVGKTVSSVYYLNDGYEIVGDNFVIVKDNMMYSFATPMLLFTYNLRGPLKDRLSRKIRRTITLKNLLYQITLGYAKFLTPIQLDEAFPGQLTQQMEMDNIVFTLASDSFDVKRNINKSSLPSSFCAINKFETFYYLKMMEAYSFVFPESSLATHWGRLEAVFVSIIQNIPCHLMQVPAIYTYDTYRRMRKFTDSLNG